MGGVERDVERQGYYQEVDSMGSEGSVQLCRAGEIWETGKYMTQSHPGKEAVLTVVPGYLSTSHPSWTEGNDQGHFRPALAQPREAPKRRIIAACSLTLFLCSGKVNARGMWLQIIFLNKFH